MELIPIVDEQGNVLGSITRQHAHDGSCVLHPVVHLHVFNSQGQLYLQHRPKWKDIQPDRWDTATGGHVDYGETIEEALRREVSEELGITDYQPRFLTRYVFKSEQEQELVHVFTTTYDGPIHPSPTELDGGRFWTTGEIEQAIGQGILTPNFEQEYLTKLKVEREKRKKIKDKREKRKEGQAYEAVEASLVHGFFDGYFTGLLEARLPEGARPEPRQLKQLAAEQYGTLAGTFAATLLPTLLTLRFDSYEAAVADMRQRRFSDTTSPKLLLRYAAGTRQAYDALTGEYRRQVEALLTGRLCPHPSKGESPDSADAPAAPAQSESPAAPAQSESPDDPATTERLIRATVRTTMQAYALGVRTGGGSALRQPTVFRLMADAMAVLLRHGDTGTWADMERIGLDGVYRRVCRTRANYDTLLAEMSQAYDDLARD